METLTNENANQRQLAIVERFEGFINYLYPIAINIPRAHYIVRDQLVAAMFAQVSLFYQASKTSQVSKLYLADAGLADLRFLLRFLADTKRRFITPHQCEVAGTHLAEVGNMLGAWIRNKAAKG